jgi:hypothetical protein
MRVVRETHPGRDRDVILDDAEARDVAVRVDGHAIPDRARDVDDRVVPDLTVVADRGVRADLHIDAGLDAVADVDAVMDRGPTADDPSGADVQPAAGARPGLGQPAEPNVVFDAGARSHAHVRGIRPAALVERGRTLCPCRSDVVPSHRAEPSAAK